MCAAIRITPQLISEYLGYCKNEKRLADKTIRAYKCDLEQFEEWFSQSHFSTLDRNSLRMYLSYLNEIFSPRSAKRKIASLKAFFSFLEVEKDIDNPFHKIKINIKEPKRLPRTIPIQDLRKIIGSITQIQNENLTIPNCSIYKKFVTLRNQAIIELMIATGIRVSELCGLDISSCDMEGKSLTVFGKGSKERVIQLECNKTISAVKLYLAARTQWEDQLTNVAPSLGENRESIKPHKKTCDMLTKNAFQATDISHTQGSFANSPALFVNRFHNRISEQTVRAIVDKHARIANASVHITPHMFRHTFATLLLEEDVDIRYIQSLLGHSSIKTTEIYTHVSTAKQRQIMRLHNPRDVIER